MKVMLLTFLVVGLTFALASLVRALRRERTRPANDPDRFSIPKPQRVETAIATLEQLLEETDDPIIREALQNRLEQLRAERRRLRESKR